MKRSPNLAYYGFFSVASFGVFAVSSVAIAVLLTIRIFEAGTISAVIDLAVFLAFMGAMVGLAFFLLSRTSRTSGALKAESQALRTEDPNALIPTGWGPRSLSGGILKILGTNRGVRANKFYFLRIDHDGLALISSRNHEPVFQEGWDAVRELRSPGPALSMTQQVFVVTASQKGDRRYQLRVASTKPGDGRLDASELSRLNSARNLSR